VTVGSVTTLNRRSYRSDNAAQKICANQQEIAQMSIVPINGPARLSTQRGPSRSGIAGFRMPSETAGPLPQAAVAALGSVVGLSAMLSLQDVDPPQERDRRARRRGEGLLASLAQLQLALLGDGGAAAALTQLAGLAQPSEIAADPALREAIAAIELRAAVELARAEFDAGHTRLA
jgi:hypothetical protein